MDREQIGEAYVEVNDYLSSEYGEIFVDHSWFDEDHCWVLFRSLGEEEDEFYELREQNNPPVHVAEAPELDNMDVEDIVERYASITELSEEKYHERGETQGKNQQAHDILGPGSSPFEKLLED